MVRARTLTTALKVPSPQDFLALLTWEHNRITQHNGGNPIAADATEESKPAPKLHQDGAGQEGLTIAGLINLKGNLS